MKQWTRRQTIWVATAIAAVVSVSMIVGIQLGARREQRSTDQLVETFDWVPGQRATEVTYGELINLPEPVKKYLRHVLRNGQPAIRRAQFTQTGELRTDVNSKRWMHFEATHIVAPPSRGFVWNAKVIVFPFIHLRVRDAYVDGAGSGRVSLLSAIPISSQGDRMEVNSGALHRYLAEAVWYPTALAPGEGLTWSPISSNKALATLTDGQTTVSLEFRFDDADEVVGVFSPGRWGAFDGEFKQVEWEGHFRNYREMNGMRVPAYGEVGWHSYLTWECVWKGEITSANYTFDR